MTAMRHWLLCVVLLVLGSGALVDSRATRAAVETETKAQADVQAVLKWHMDEPRGGGEDKQTEDDDDSSSGDAVENLIDKMMHHGGVHPQKLQKLGSTGSKIALANENTVHKVGQDDDTTQEMSREAATKKAFEASTKSGQEARHKIVTEEREKRIDIQRQKIKQEENQKNFADDLRLKSEQAAKANREEERKGMEEGSKRVKTAQANAEMAKAKLERQEELEKAQMKADEMTAKEKANFERQKGEEEIRKHHLRERRKRDANQREFKRENFKKEVEEESEKKKHKVAVLKAQEEHEKETKRIQAKQAETNQKAFKESQAKHRKTAVGKHCHCRNQRVHLGHMNRWHNCPSGYLLTGVYRNSRNDMAGILYFRCCRPCRDDGRSIMQVNACQNANWMHSFDRAGWSNCPHHTYIQGFYKSGCNHIYCLEYARCCRIQDSRGRQSCRGKNWWRSLDRAGWSQLDNHHFMVGLYRTGGVALSNIESANQCNFYAFG